MERESAMVVRHLITGRSMPGRWLIIGMVFALLMATTLGGCATSGASGPSAAQMPSSAASPTSSPGLESSPSPAGVGSGQTCTTGAGASSQGSSQGDLAMSVPTALYGFNMDYMLPDGLSPDKPLPVTLQQNVGYVLGAAIESRPVLQGAFVITVCNTSSTRTHHLTSFGVMLDSLTAYTGQLNVLNGCAFLYSRPTGTGGECASGYSPDLELTTFQMSGSAAPHATVAQTPASPIELAPGHALDISFSITSPSSPAIATYRLGLGVDGAAVVYPSALVTQPRMTASIARRWAGNFCNTAQMQAQIPATIPANTYYVCPQV